MHGKMEVQLHVFSDSGLDGGYYLALCSSHFYPCGKRDWYQLHKRLGGPKNQSRRYDEETIPARNRAQIHWSSSP
jgi:hypothetical protein